MPGHFGSSAVARGRRGCVSLRPPLPVAKALCLAARAARRVRQAQQALNSQLEQKVEERTRELERANRRLHALAVTDELTGAFNRRQFNDTCASLLASRTRDEPLALCMFDLDHFKRFNDRYGHQAGDLALRSAADAVQRCLQREGDALFRLGGEEFAVLYTAASEDMALAFAERLRLAIAELHMAHADNPAGVLTASFGVAFVRPEQAHATGPEALYAVADGALYAAKAEGRNRVVQRPVA